MIITHGKTETCVARKSSVGSYYQNGWWFERVLGWEAKDSMVLSILKRSIWRAGDDIVPFQDIFLVRFGGDERRRVCLDCFVLFGQTLLTLYGCHCGLISLRVRILRVDSWTRTIFLVGLPHQKRKAIK